MPQHTEDALGTSLVVQWRNICPPVQGTQLWSLLREDSTCCRATKTTGHNCWACALQQEKPLQWEAHTPQRAASITASRENLSIATKTQHRQKKKKKEMKELAGWLQECNAKEWRESGLESILHCQLEIILIYPSKKKGLKQILVSDFGM